LGGRLEGVRDVPAGLIHHHDGVRAGRNGFRQHVKEAVHRRCGDVGGDHRLGGVALRADGAEDPGGTKAVVAGAARPVAAGVPAAGQPPLLADAALVGKPDLDALGLGMRRGDLAAGVGKVFLNVCCAF
jgi:hypothetical protein